MKFLHIFANKKIFFKNMSIITFKSFGNYIQVAADGRTVSGDQIISENTQKIKKLSDCLIIEVTGLYDSIGIFEKFVICNQKVFEKLNDNTEGLVLMKRFKDYLENYGYNENAIKDLGGFLVVNKNFTCVFYFDDHCLPYTHLYGANSGAIGSTSIYTSALIDAGFPLKEAIKMSAKKYNSINDNVTTLEIQK